MILKVRVESLLLILFLSLEVRALSPPLCSEAFSHPYRLINTFRPGPKDNSFLLFRANAGHFWEWISTLHHPVFEPRGVVAGDAHILNFDDVRLRNGRRDYILTDLDDGALDAPLFADFLRLAVSSRMSPYRVSPSELLASYKLGLLGLDAKAPKVLRKTRDADFKDSLASVEAYIKDGTEKNSLRLKKAMIRPENADPSLRSLYNSVSLVFLTYLTDHHFKVLDLMFRVKAEGGSQNLPRFLYLVERDGVRSVIEFKMTVPPAAGLMSRDIPDSTYRFEQLMKFYGRRDVAPVFDWIKVGKWEFHVREKEPPLMEFDPAKTDDAEVEADAKKMYLYIAWKLGQAHGLQDKDLAQILNRNSGIDEQVETWVSFYSNNLQELNRQFEN